MSLRDDASLILIPSAIKDGEVLVQKPLPNKFSDETGNYDGNDPQGSANLTFTRNSNATRVDANGLVEKVRTNSLLQSNSFDTTWANSNSTETGGQAGYDGGTTAWKIDKTAALGYIRQAISQSGVQTFSVYAKAGTLNWIRLIADGGTSTPSTWFDLANGVVGTADFFTIDSNIESVGGGWHRCSITFEVGSINGVRIYPADNNNDVSGTSGNIYIQDAQLEQGLVATDYIETTTTAMSEFAGVTASSVADVPRLDYSGDCPSLLLEPSRTNADPNSEYLANKPIVTNVSVTTNSTTSPEGVVNASTITNNTTSGQHQLTDNTFSVTSGTDYTMSLFLKYNDAQYVRLQFGGTPFGTTNWQNFDVLNGTKGSSGGGITSADASIEDYGNGWYRCIVTADATATGSNGAFQIRILEDDNTNDVPSFAGNGLSTYAYGAQWEAGSYPTSYLPSYGTTVTRLADSCSKTGISSLIGQTEGTMFVEIGKFPEENNGRILSISDGSLNNYIIIIHNTLQDNLAVYASSGGAVQVAYTGSGTLTDGAKVAVGYKLNDYVIYINGTQVHTDTSAAVPVSPSLVYLGTRENGASTYQMGGSISQALLFKTRLSNADLANLTAL